MSRGVPRRLLPSSRISRCLASEHLRELRDERQEVICQEFGSEPPVDRQRPVVRELQQALIGIRALRHLAGRHHREGLVVGILAVAHPVKCSAQDPRGQPPDVERKHLAPYLLRAIWGRRCASPRWREDRQTEPAPERVEEELDGGVTARLLEMAPGEPLADHHGTGCLGQLVGAALDPRGAAPVGAPQPRPLVRVVAVLVDVPVRAAGVPDGAGQRGAQLAVERPRRPARRTSIRRASARSSSRSAAITWLIPASIV